MSSKQFNAGGGWVAWFVSNPVAANLLMAVILLAGAVTAFELRKEGFPSLPPDEVTVSVSYSSGSAKAAEEGVAIKIEEALQSVQGIKQITSQSSTSSVTVTIEKESDYDLDKLNQDVKIRVDAIKNLPEAAEKPVISQAEHVDHAIWAQIYGDADQDVLQDLADQLRDELLADSEIKRVTTYGDRTPEITVEISESRLQSYGLTLAEVSNAINGSSLIRSGGELRSADGYLVIKADDQKYRRRDFESIVVKEQTNGARITLGDIAEVNDAYDDTPVLSRFNGEPSIALKVEMVGDSDIMKVSERAAQITEAFRENLPQGVSSATWYDKSSAIVDRLNLMYKNSFQGILLVLVLLALFLNFRVALWVAAGIPISIAGAVFLMGDGLSAMTINSLTTFGFIMALGIVVDDAVVIGESIHTEQSQRGANVASTIRGVQRVLVPATFGVLTTIVAFAGLQLVEGKMGQLFAQFGIVVIFCLVFSLIESKLILPAHLAHVREKKQQGRKHFAARWLEAVQEKVRLGLEHFTHRYYRRALHVLLEYRYATLAAMLALFIVVAGLIPSGAVRFVFFPNVPGDVINVQLTMQDDVGYGLTQREALRIEQAAQDLNAELIESKQMATPIIANLQVRVASETDVSITAELAEQSQRALTIDEVAALWQKKVGAVEGARAVKFITAFDGPEDLRVELASNDNETLTLANDRLIAALQEYAGVENMESTLKVGQPQITLSLTDSGRALGLTTAQLSAQVQQNFQGYEAQSFQRGKDEVKVKIRYPSSDRSHVDDLVNARVRTDDGRVLPLLSVAKLESSYVANEITRVDRKQVAVVTADVDKNITSPQEILTVLQNGELHKLQLDYPGLTVNFGGEATEQAETSASFIKAFALALFGIYALLAIPLRSYGQPLIIMTAIPFGVVGAILGHWMVGISMSLLSLFGVLALSGVVVNDSLLIVAEFNEARQSGMAVKEAVKHACASRLRAILLTSSTTFVGLAPLIYETSVQAQFLIPAAVALGYGILFATVITLVLIPVLLAISEDMRSLIGGRRHQADDNSLASAVLGAPDEAV
ncbi:efflux RND transporter permease subunit [Hahella sp. KA22]|uniref:efflux RND transporter permease subunit n=1 Tax=Hahella sp. KA22 TaxID=1628392 RepID=UPI000FDE6FA1|nr:efflux RND transporter permease subunit [Hahella sp. KA22]AZZ91978.1 efflux RND transporter permease subunit [Hahella sp. KA22]QAY55349.1 efflux RND transporter permease subunit [Hahella sp. KA22]